LRPTENPPTEAESFYYVANEQPQLPTKNKGGASVNEFASDPGGKHWASGVTFLPLLKYNEEKKPAFSLQNLLSGAARASEKAAVPYVVDVQPYGSSPKEREFVPAEKALNTEALSLQEMDKELIIPVEEDYEEGATGEEEGAGIEVDEEEEGGGGGRGGMEFSVGEGRELPPPVIRWPDSLAHDRIDVAGENPDAGWLSVPSYRSQAGTHLQNMAMDLTHMGTRRQEQENLGTWAHEEEPIGMWRQKQEPLGPLKQEDEHVGTWRQEQEHLGPRRQEDQQLGVWQEGQGQRLGTHQHILEEHNLAVSRRHENEHSRKSKKDTMIKNAEHSGWEKVRSYEIRNRRKHISFSP
jgi:hypothetical protein